MRLYCRPFLRQNSRLSCRTTFLFMPSIHPSTSKLLFVFIAGILLLGGLVACENDGSTVDDVEVVEPRLVETPSGDRAFTGALVNHRPNTISIAQIEVGLYDDEGSRIETMRFEVEDIAPDDSVEFNQTIDSDEPIQQAQVQSILTP